MRVVLVTDNEPLVSALRRAAPEHEISAVSARNAAAAVRASADVLVLADWSADAVAVARARASGTRLLAVVADHDPDVVREAVRLRAADVVFGMDVESVAAALRHLPAEPASAPHARQEFAGNTVALLSPHGGAGRTAAAVNLALALAERAPTVLWDCVGWYGTCHVVLDLDPGVAIDGLRAETTEELEMLLVPIEGTQLRLLPAPAEPQIAGTYTPEVTETVLDKLLRLAQWVVFDTERVITPAVAAVLDRAHLVVVLTRLTVASVRNLRAYLDGFLRQYPPEKVLLAGVELPRAPLSPRHVADLAGITIEHILPFDPAVLRADADGVPVWLASPRSPYAQAIARLADAIAERLGQSADVSR